MRSPLWSLILLVCSVVFTQAATPPSEFLNVAWGASAAEVKREMLLRSGVTLKGDDPVKLIYEGGTFAECPVEKYELTLAGGRFQSGVVHLVIPAGKSKDGAPLRNHQFEDFVKSLSNKYGKGKRTGDGRHTQVVWDWTTADPRSGQKRTISILLSYSWDPYDFMIRYANEPVMPSATLARPGRSQDL